MMTHHVQFLLLVLAGWVNRQQQDVIDYQQEENRVVPSIFSSASPWVSEVSPAARNTLDFARIPRVSKLLICGLFQKGRVLAQDGVHVDTGLQRAFRAKVSSTGARGCKQCSR